MLRFVLLFVLIVTVLLIAELTPPVQAAFVLPFTALIADISAWVMQTFDDQVRAQGKVIWDQASGFAVSIEAGCNGVEAGIVLVAAMLAFPASWRERAIGIGVGLFTVQALNLVRIVSLFYLGQWNKNFFEWAHLYVWQALIMLDVLLVFLIWLRWISKRAHGAGAHAIA
ncbi:exosortase H, IPTLxxWG-CTERM-specific [Thiocapsa roseopersicina]|uniref:Exosortase H, IPTLxxWG-CTERM-specific n=2 Tax=Thiocapsa roseopersicina TaxID=1058 RepID=A0A1H2V2F8_THIRO|nr:exosortase H, IPTLxxWG-CTERM-specific [Thiocapsa roseopersicina]